MDAQLERLRQRIRDRQQLPPPAERRAIRIAADVTLEEVAEAVGAKHRSSVWGWEQGTSEPNADVLPRYLEVLALMRETVEQGATPIEA